MEESLYELVKNKEITLVKTGETRETQSWKPFLRQLMVCSGVWTAFFTSGLSTGAPTVIIPQLRSEANSTDVVSDKMASWLYSINGFASIPWFVLPFISARFGRKYPFFFISIINLISYIFFYCSQTPTHIFIARILQAPLLVCQLTISVFIIAEFSSPKYRGIFLTIKSAGFFWGIWVANALGTFFHWRTIAITGIVCMIYNIATTLFWCESPAWLATRHRYKECAKVHRWIKGNNEESERELTALINSCKQHKNKQMEDIINHPKFWIRLYRTLSDMAFYKPLILNIATKSIYHSSGKMICTSYAVEILKNITSTESAAYMGMLILDGVTIIGMYVGCGISKFLKRRTLFFTGSLGAIIFLYTMSLYLFLIKLTVINENKIISLGILSMFFLFISCGPMILSTSIYGELTPLRYRTEGMFIIGIYTVLLASTTLKTAPLTFKLLGLHGVFLFYASVSLLILIVLYKHLPETKDKTLEEIEEYFINKPRQEEAAETQPIMSK